MPFTPQNMAPVATLWVPAKHACIMMQNESICCILAKTVRYNIPTDATQHISIASLFRAQFEPTVMMPHSRQPNDMTHTRFSLNPAMPPTGDATAWTTARARVIHPSWLGVASNAAPTRLYSEGRICSSDRSMMPAVHVRSSDCAQ